MKLLVLAGGFGTRLRDVVADVPKPLAPIGDTPFLELQIDHWLGQGIRDFTFLLHHQADSIIAFLENYRMRDIPSEATFDWLIEPAPLNTGGAVAHAVNEIGLLGDFLVTNADTWLGGGIREIFESVAPTLSVVKLVNTSRYGLVKFNDQNDVTAFIEKDSGSTAGWINAGLCKLSGDIFSGWDGLPFSLEHDLFELLVEEKRVKALTLSVDFIDIGVPEDYHRFRRWQLVGRQGIL